MSRVISASEMIEQGSDPYQVLLAAEWNEQKAKDCRDQAADKRRNPFEIPDLIRDARRHEQQHDDLMETLRGYQSLKP